jgi:hypothetical protein
MLASHGGSITFLELPTEYREGAARKGESMKVASLQPPGLKRLCENFRFAPSAAEAALNTRNLRND